MTTTETPAVPWIGEEPEFRVAPAVPAEVVQAITAYETARVRRQRANEQYKLFRNAGCPLRAQDALQACSVNARLMEQWWGHLAALLPMEAGWWPHLSHGHVYLYGYAKRGKQGFELVRRDGWSAWPDPAKAAAWRGAQARRAEDEARERAFFSNHSQSV